MGQVLQRGRTHTAKGAASGCHFVASLARRAVNDAVRKAKVRKYRVFSTGFNYVSRMLSTLYYAIAKQF